MPSLGDTYWAQNPDNNNPPHLYFVIATPTGNGKYYILVNMTKRKPCSDTSCILLRGDHRSVTCESVIQYMEAIHTEASLLQTVIERGSFIPGPRASKDLIRRIQEGGLKSCHFTLENQLTLEAEISNRAPREKNQTSQVSP